MTDLRTSTPILEDSSTAAGLPLHKVLEGDALAAKNALAALIAKSGSNLAYLKVKPSTGALMVDTSGAVVNKKNSPAGELAAGSATIVAVTGAEIALSVGKVYNSVSIVCSSRRDSLFQIIWLDDVTETVICEFIVGSGAFTVVETVPDFEITAGSTGVQKLLVKAKNFEALSSLRASIFAAEVQ